MPRKITLDTFNKHLSHIRSTHFTQNTEMTENIHPTAQNHGALHKLQRPTVPPPVALTVPRGRPASPRP